ncbi:MAG: shikimate dehydrogenase [Castellaniella sp.]|uniref:shikimate dehydrogenase n=1 Tax=Castellaniella sp. TaxID=1955812 RepID=UPI002A366478|nr:shikimate dehydrogenase [Castellaniella sp.]MDY0309704.1 shikimate dehydrogenase [Castellaniella sp.]
MTDLYAVIGNPIAQSKSPLLHTAFARQFGHDLRYDAILAAPDAFRETVQAFVAAGGRGMNVTAPFKLEAAELADTLTDRARAAGAVNTLTFGPEGILGDNTDGVGLVGDIQDRLGFSLVDRRVLVIGAGGAARGILLPLLLARPASVLVVNRTAARAQALAEAMAHAGPIQAGPLEAAGGWEYDVVIHATSAGLNEGEAPAVDYRVADDGLAYDLAYGADTPFMRQARDRGAAQVADGLGMLVGQAAESYRVWRGVLPDVRPVLEQLALV